MTMCVPGGHAIVENTLTLPYIMGVVPSIKAWSFMKNSNRQTFSTIVSHVPLKNAILVIVVVFQLQELAEHVHDGPVPVAVRLSVVTKHVQVMIDTRT